MRNKKTPSYYHKLKILVQEAEPKEPLSPIAMIAMTILTGALVLIGLVVYFM